MVLARGLSGRRRRYRSRRRLTRCDADDTRHERGDSMVPGPRAGRGGGCPQPGLAEAAKTSARRPPRGCCRSGTTGGRTSRYSSNRQPRAAPLGSFAKEVRRWRGDPFTPSMVEGLVAQGLSACGGRVSDSPLRSRRAHRCDRPPQRDGGMRASPAAVGSLPDSSPDRPRAARSCGSARLLPW